MLAKTRTGRKRKNVQDKFDLIIHAATNNPNNERTEVYIFFDAHKMCYSENVTVAGRQFKKRKDDVCDISREFND